MRGAGVKKSAGRRAGGFLKIGVVPSWELYFGVIWLGTCRRPFWEVPLSLWTHFWVVHGSLLELFEGLGVPLDVLDAGVRVFWMPLGSRGLLLGSVGAHRAAEGVFKLNFDCFFHNFK